MGASGTGTTTLGRALAIEWSVPHADVDDYFWEPSEPPYTTKRDPDTRVELMERIFIPRSAWVLSGSVISWGDALIGSFDAVIFVTVERTVRLARLREREARRYGSRIEPGGDREEAFADFLEWAAGYDHPQGSPGEVSRRTSTGSRSSRALCSAWTGRSPLTSSSPRCSHGAPRLTHSPAMRPRTGSWGRATQRRRARMIGPAATDGRTGRSSTPGSGVPAG